MTEMVRVSQENWQWLNGKKEPRESFNDVLDRLRDEDPHSGEGPSYVLTVRGRPKEDGELDFEEWTEFVEGLDGDRFELVEVVAQLDDTTFGDKVAKMEEFNQ